MKRILCFVITAILLLSAFPMAASAEEVTVVVSGMDCNRDAGKLIVYTDKYGESTSTNQWGAEAIVNSDNQVTSLTTGDAPIPDGGFVVSGHDDDRDGGKKMKTWVQQNITVGDYVYFDRRTSMLTVSDTPIEDATPFFSFDNPADDINIPRDDDKMILYTPEYGKTTGTNEYGYEVVVEDGIVTKLGGNNSVIPQNGYVVSLHGHPAGWMRLKIVKGMTVTYDPETLNVIFNYNAEGLKKAVTYSINTAKAGIEAAKAAYINADYAATEEALAAIEAEYQTVLDTYQKDGKDTRFADDCDDLILRADMLCNALCDSYTVQYRGVWIRPSEKTAKQVKATIKELHDNGINFVCVEGWFENGVIMEVPEDSLFGRHPSFNYDVLQAYIDACHEYGMECHLWMPVMCIGSMAHKNFDENTVPGGRPEWLSLNNYKSPYNKDGFMMLDPANEDAKNYVIDFYKYLVTTYDLDCLELDYIRYYAQTAEEDYGYTEAAIQGFEEAYGHGVTPRYDPRAEYWDDWCQYRRDCVTQWVRDIRAMMDKEAPDMLLGADVAFPFEHALDKVYQEFPLWLEEGLIDVLHPMAYGDGYGEEITKAVELAGDKCMVVTGLGAQVDILGAKELERQAREDNLYGAYGDCFFEAVTYLSDKIPAAVKQTVYRNDAIPPFLDVDASLRAALDYLVDRIDNVIVPFEGMSDKEAAALKKAVNKAKDAVEDGSIDASALNALRKAVAAVKNKQAKLALDNDLYRVEHILGVNGTLPKDSADGNGVNRTVLVVTISTVAVLLCAAAVLKMKKKTS